MSKSIDLTNARILITGATGFIGGHLALRLQTGEGAQVRALVRNPAKAADLAAAGIELFPGDLTDPAAVRQAMAGCQIVYHAAAYVGEKGDTKAIWAVNVTGTETAVATAAEAGVERFVQVSSCAVYGSRQQMDIDESTPVRTTGRVYHDSKVAAEEAVWAAQQKWGLSVIVARPSQVYGLDSPQFTLRVIKSIQSGKVVLVDGGRHLFKPVYIGNLADALVLCGSSGTAAGQALNLTDGYTKTWAELFTAYGRTLGVTGFRSVPYQAAWLMALVNEAKDRVTGRTSSLNREVVKTFHSHNSFSNARARQVLGWEPAVGFEEGMQRTEAWLRAHAYLT